MAFERVAVATTVAIFSLQLFVAANCFGFGALRTQATICSTPDVAGEDGQGVGSVIKELTKI